MGHGITRSSRVPATVSRRDLAFAAAGLLTGGLLTGCGRRDGGGARSDSAAAAAAKSATAASASAEPATAPAAATLRTAIVGRGEGDIDLMLRTAGIRPDHARLEFSSFPSGQLVIEALNGGSLDIGGMSEIPPLFAAASPIHSFRQIAVLHGDVNNQVVLVPAASPVRSIAQLKGLRVGYIRATTTQYFLTRMLDSAGLSWSDIVAVPLGVADGLAAFANGTLDAWAIYGYPIQRLIATQGARILRTALGSLSGNYIIAAHVDALADPVRVGLIRDYLRTLKRGYAWTAAHEDEWAAVIAKDIGVPLEYVRDEFRRRSDRYSLRPVDDAAIASQQTVADVFAKQGLLPQGIDVRSLWDDRFNDTIVAIETG
jgi:sulfonate transport system substrate-binding protein